MRRFDNQDSILYRLYLIFSIVGSMSGVGLLLFNILSAKSMLFIIVSTIYFTTVVIFILIFSMRWNSIFHPRFLAAVKQSGITGIYPNKDINHRRIIQALSGQLENKEIKKIKIMAYYGHRLLFSIKDNIEKAIKDGVYVKIIIAENNATFIKEVWELESAVDTKSTLAAKTKVGCNNQKEALDMLIGFDTLSKSIGGKFEYKICNTQVRYALILINNDWAWWTPYQPGIEVKNSTSFVLEKQGDDSILSQCIDHFNALWKVLP